MSKISDIFDLLKTTVTTTLPTHQQLINPYFPEIDSELTYSAAFGVAFAEGVNLLGNEASGTEQRQRTFIITLTRRKFATKADITARETTEKELLDDWTTLMDVIAQDQTLGRPDLMQRIIYLNDNGIEFLRTDINRNDILLIRTILQVDYEDVVNLCT